MRRAWWLIGLVASGCLHFQRQHYVYEPAAPTVDPPSADLGWITVPLRAFSLRNDDGTKRCEATTGQIERWVAEANRVYLPAKIRFEFNPALFEPVLSTVLNEITGGDDAKWKAQRAAGEALAAKYPGRVVLLFRHGPDRASLGNGFAGGYPFVVMPSLQQGVFCGHANLGILAHELGHHFGLPHTFPEIFASVWAAEDRFESDPERFDGDAISDTAPDPFFRDEEFECNPKVSGVRLRGRVFWLPRENVMSYFDSARKVLTAGQIQLVRQGALRRTGQDLRQVFSGTSLPPVEHHDVASAIAVTGGKVTTQDMTDFIGTWGHGDQALWTGGFVGSSMTIPFSVPEEGRFELWGGFTLAPDFAQLEASIDDGPALGLPIDLYGRGVRHSSPVLLGPSALTAGEHRVRLRISGRNRRSTGYLVGFDYLLLKSSPPPVDFRAR